MAMTNTCKRKLLKGEPAIGAWLSIGSPIAAEIVASAGYDAVVLDHEHGPGDFLNAISLMQAVGEVGPTPMMRVPWNDTVYIKRALDIGVMGIIVPYVQNAEEARSVVDACRYPLRGIRALFALGRATRRISRCMAQAVPHYLPDRNRGGDREYRGDRRGGRGRYAILGTKRRLSQRLPYARPGASCRNQHDRTR